MVSNQEYVYVRKVIDRNQCSLKPMEWSSAPSFFCAPSGADDAYSASTTREYTLARSGENKTRLELRHINSSSRLYVQPFSASAEAQHAHQHQEYRLNGTSDELVEPPRDPVNRTLEYEYHPRDLTHGRAPMAQSIALKEMKMLLEQLVGSLDAHGLGRDAGRRHSRALTQLYYRASLLDLRSLRRLYSDIGIGTSYHLETSRNMFLELLPQVGTRDSLLFLKELVANGTVKDLAAIKLLAVFPFYVRQHSPELIDDMSGLLDLGDAHEQSVRHAAVLGFATLVNQAMMAGRCPLDVLDHYARKYYERYSQSITHEKKMLYLQGLDNLQLGPVFDYLRTIVEDDSLSRHERFLGVWASMSSAPFRSADIYEIYWPILVNRTQHLEMRIAAFTMLLVAQPTKARFLTLYWYMQGEPDQHLYRIFYTTLVSMHRTTYPCYTALGRLAAHIVRFARKPTSNRQWATGNHLLDYHNTQSNFGGMLQLFLVGDPRNDAPCIVYFTFHNYANGRSLNQGAVYLKLYGLPHHIRKVFADRKTDEPVTSKYVKELMEQLQSAGIEMLPPDELHLEVIIKVQAKTVFCHFFNNQNFDQLAKSKLVYLIKLTNNYRPIPLFFRDQKYLQKIINVRLKTGFCHFFSNQNFDQLAKSKLVLFNIIN